jgi:DNA excision repair protein ERCC-4
MASAASGGDISPASIISKLSLLALHFKKLQIIWSRSPQHTAEIFRALKDMPEHKNNDPDLQKINRTGKLGNDNEDDDADDDDEFNKYMPIEFLKRIPGLDSSRLNDLTKKGRTYGLRTIVDICKSDEETLGKVIGRNSAKEVLEFLTRKVDFAELNK